MPLPFRFDDGAGPAEAADRGVIVPGGLRSREALFDALQAGLCLPSYFGRNWDALDEVLRDLSWLEPGEVTLRHADLPDIGDEPLAIYLEILQDAVLGWRAEGERALVVVFPAATRERIARLVGAA